MNNKNKTWFAMIIIGYIVVLMAYVINVVAENKPAVAGNKPTAAAEDSPAVAENQYASTAENHAAIECGSCGAHVYEYWYWENINDGTPVKICRYCYENCIENTDTEN